MEMTKDPKYGWYIKIEMINPERKKQDIALMIYYPQFNIKLFKLL